MNKVEKPKLFKTPILTTVSTILGLLAFYSFFNQIDDKIKFIISSGIVILIIIYNIFSYYRNVNKLYVAYEERVTNHEALAEQYKNKKKELADKNNTINLYSKALFNAYNTIMCIMSAKSEDEVQRIKDQQIAQVFSDMSVINFLNGGNKNE